MEKEYIKKLRLARIKQPLEIKEKLTINRIEQFIERLDGNVYLSFSGGMGSTVLYDIVNRINPDIKKAFIDTGNEYPEIRKFVKTKPDVIWLKPEKNHQEVLQKYGFPVVSKEQAGYIEEVRNCKTNKARQRRCNDEKGAQFIISKKHRYLIDAPFKISDKCCDYLKKKPAIKFEKETGLSPILGNMAAESSQRKQLYLKNGCNAFDAERPTSKPLSFWTQQDLSDYIKKYDLEYSSIYNKGYDRTGCMFCAFGLGQESFNKFQKMKNTHPVQHDYCINKLGFGKVLDFMQIPYTNLIDASQLNMFNNSVAI